jgi:hypothetical protein
MDSAVDNLEDWKDAFKDLSKSELMSSDYIDDIADAYADLLDIDASTLDISDILDADNLKLFE